VRTIFTSAVLLISLQSIGQNAAKTELGYVLKAVIVGNDTIPHATLGQVAILPPLEFANNADYLRYRKLVRDVKTVYPYSLMAREVFNEVVTNIGTMDNRRDQRQYVRAKDKELQDKYTEELKKLTITQGRILIKLIERETGHTSYDVVKELRGGLSAFMWQQMARLFGSNLKTGFDAEGEDHLINRIIIMIESGQL
jgi:hypothetical protein